MVRFLVFGRVQWPRAHREMSGRRNKVAADYYRTAAARRWADYCLAALTGTHGGGNGGEDKQKNTFDRLDATVTASLVLAPALPVRPKKEKKHTHSFFLAITQTTSSSCARFGVFGLKRCGWRV